MSGTVDAALYDLRPAAETVDLRWTGRSSGFEPEPLHLHGHISEGRGGKGLVSRLSQRVLVTRPGILYQRKRENLMEESGSDANAEVQIGGGRNMEA